MKYKDIGMEAADNTTPSRLSSLGKALKGLGFVLKRQPNAWLHLTATVVVILLASFLQVRLEDWRWLIVVLAMVWTAEAVNTAIAHVSSMAPPDYAEAAGRARDIAAGAVLVCVVSAVVIGFLTLWPYAELMMDRFHGPVSL